MHWAEKRGLKQVKPGVFRNADNSINVYSYGWQERQEFSENPTEFIMKLVADLSVALQNDWMKRLDNQAADSERLTLAKGFFQDKPAIEKALSVIKTNNIESNELRTKSEIASLLEGKPLLPNEDPEMSLVRTALYLGAVDKSSGIEQWLDSSKNWAEKAQRARDFLSGKGDAADVVLGLAIVHAAIHTSERQIEMLRFKIKLVLDEAERR